MNTKTIKALVTFLTIARTFNCENHIVCDNMGNKLTIERIGSILGMNIEDLREYLETLEKYDFIVLIGDTEKHIVLDPRLNCVLRKALTHNSKYNTRDIRLFSRSYLRFGFHLVLRTVISLNFDDNGTIVGDNGKPLCKSKIAEKINIRKDTLRICFEQLAVLSVIDIDKTKSGHYVTINPYLFSELKKFIR